MDLDLKYSAANAKTESLAKVRSLKKYLKDKRKIFSLDLLSGFSCPSANACLSKVVQIGGKRKIKDGPNCEFRCFSASQELIYKNTYERRSKNFNSLRAFKSAADMFLALNSTMPQNLGICRIHVAGDMFSREYMRAWMIMAATHPDRLFYAYTKSLPWWIEMRKDINKIPNFVLTASFGGRHDKLIGKHRLRSAKVIFSEAEAKRLKLPIDHDDSHAADPTKQKQSFALLLLGRIC